MGLMILQLYLFSLYNQMTPLYQALELLVKPIEAEHAVVSPGSRNAPIIKSLVNAGYTTHSVVDERSAGFQALGMAKYLRQAVVLTCTSGTAALNYYPAIAEAFYARIPLIVLTADRPPAAIDNWDGQAIRQQHVFSNHVRLSLQTSTDLLNDKDFKKIAFEVNEYLENDVHGPIHINIPISEPFYSSEASIAPVVNRQFIKNDSILLLDLDDYLPTGLNASKYLIVNGMEDGDMVLVQTKDDNSYEQLVVLSDITSNQASSVLHWDAMLYCMMRNCPDKIAELQADVLVTTGTTNVSKGLRQFLKKYPPKHHFHISGSSEIGDPFDTSPTYIDPYKPKRQSTSMIEADPKYSKAWNVWSTAYFQEFLNLDWSEFNEFSAVKTLLPQLTEGCSLHLANSMPVRYASFLIEEVSGMEIYGNRGTSGIDGSTSTAIGHAMLCNSQVFLLTGDVAFFYDINAFYRSDLPHNLKVIVLNNEGGRIFELIDGPEKQIESLPFQLTEHKRSIESICSHFGMEYFCAQNFEDLDLAIEELKQSEKLSVLEVKTNPLLNKSFYTQFKEIKL